MAKAEHELERLQKYGEFEWIFADDPKAKTICISKTSRLVSKESGWYAREKNGKQWFSKEFPHSAIDDCFSCGRRTNLFKEFISSHTFHRRLKDARQTESWGMPIRLCMGCMNTYRSLVNKCLEADKLMSTVKKIERTYKDARTKNHA